MTLKAVSATAFALVATVSVAQDPARQIVIENVGTAAAVATTYMKDGEKVDSFEVKNGDQILVVLKGLNPLLFDVKIEGIRIEAPRADVPMLDIFNPGTSIVKMVAGGPRSNVIEFLQTYASLKGT